MLKMTLVKLNLNYYYNCNSCYNYFVSGPDRVVKQSFTPLSVGFNDGAMNDALKNQPLLLVDSHPINVATTYVGCFQDMTFHRDLGLVSYPLRDQSMSIVICILHCVERQLTYAALKVTIYCLHLCLVYLQNTTTIVSYMLSSIYLSIYLACDCTQYAN